MAGVANWPRYKKFLPTPSVRRATAFGLRLALAGHQFLPTPSVRRATGTSPAGKGSAEGFLPTPSVRRATW